MSVSVSERWLCEVINPLNAEVLWSHRAVTTKQIENKWQEDCTDPKNVNLINVQKLNRISVGRIKDKLVRLFKIARVEDNVIIA